ncbi:glycoside hydrolase [Mycolicibacterium tokaiense]|uniref:glycoside hydrolase n=1 Tax=Mycolicibacterium tokaiense TaxID=39695 RepID=UPI001E455A45|nr:glycoside hydrolase [Mycolicibacterium tokaiense]
MASFSSDRAPPYPCGASLLCVSKRVLSGARGRWVAVAASVVVSAGMFYAQTGDRQPVTPAVSPAGHDHVLADVPAAAVPAEAAPLLASVPAGAADIPFALPEGVTPEGGLQVRTIWVARAISVLFPEVTTIGGYRQDPLRWHPDGLAIDVMIPDHNSDAGIELGNQIAGLALANAERWGVLHVIWRQGYYPGVGAPSWTADYGNETANHFDHVHIATTGGGYPTGRETYYIGSMSKT